MKKMVFDKIQDRELRQQLDEVFTVARSESQKKKKKEKIPELAVTRIPPEEVPGLFGLRENPNSAAVWHLAGHERYPVPDYMSELLSLPENLITLLLLLLIMSWLSAALHRTKL